MKTPLPLYRFVQSVSLPGDDQPASIEVIVTHRGGGLLPEADGPSPWDALPEKGMPGWTLIGREGEFEFHARTFS